MTCSGQDGLLHVHHLRSFIKFIGFTVETDDCLACRIFQEAQDGTRALLLFSLMAEERQTGEIREEMAGTTSKLQQCFMTECFHLN